MVLRGRGGLLVGRQGEAVLAPNEAGQSGRQARPPNEHPDPTARGPAISMQTRTGTAARHLAVPPSACLLLPATRPLPCQLAYRSFHGLAAVSTSMVLDGLLASCAGPVVRLCSIGRFSEARLLE